MNVARDIGASASYRDGNKYRGANRPPRDTDVLFLLPAEKNEARNAEPGEVLDLLLACFADGARWIRGRLEDKQGNGCLTGGLPVVEAAFDTLGLR